MVVGATGTDPFPCPEIVSFTIALVFPTPPARAHSASANDVVMARSARLQVASSHLPVSTTMAGLLQTQEALLKLPQPLAGRYCVTHAWAQAG